MIKCNQTNDLNYSKRHMYKKGEKQIMSSLLQKTLQQISKETLVELTYAGRKYIQGKILDTDHEESLALFSQEGDTLFVVYEEITSLKILGQTSSGAASGLQHEQPSYEPSAPVAPQIPLESGEPAFYRIELVKQSYPDRVLNQLAGSVPKREKGAVENPFADFMHGIKSQDHAKMRQAARKLQNVLDEMQQPSRASILLSSALLIRDHNRGEAARLLQRNRLYEEAAFEFYFAGNPSHAGLSAIEALVLTAEIDEPNRLFTILEDSICSTKDISVLSEQWDRIPEEVSPFLDALIQALARRGGITLPPDAEGKEALTRLLPCYKGTDMRAFMPSELLLPPPRQKPDEAGSQQQPEKTGNTGLAAEDQDNTFSFAPAADGEQKEEKNKAEHDQDRKKDTPSAADHDTTEASTVEAADQAVPSPSESGKKTDPDSSNTNETDEDKPAPPVSTPKVPSLSAASGLPELLYGNLTYASWIKEEGSINCFFNGLSYSFTYQDVVDRKLKEALKVIDSKTLEEKPVILQFRRKEDRAWQITKVKDTAILAKDFLRTHQESEILIPVLKCLSIAPSSSIDGQCLDLLLRKAIQYHKTYQDSPVLEEMKKIYFANASKIEKTWQGYDTLVQFWWETGSYEKAIAAMEDTLALPLSVAEKLQRRILYIQLLKDACQFKKDNHYLRTILAQTAAYESEYLTADNSTRNNALCQSYYMTDLFLTESETYYTLNEFDNALASYDRIQTIPVEKTAKDRYTTLGSALEKERNARMQRQAEQEKLVQASAASSPSAEEDAEEDAYVYLETEKFDMLRLTKSDIIDHALSAEGEGRLAVLLTYLKAGSCLYPPVTSVYQAASLGVDNPMESQDYSTERLLTFLGQIDPDYAEFTEYCLASAAIRSAFGSPEAYSYNLAALHDSITLFQTIPALETLFYSIADFREKCTIPMDDLAAYHGFDKSTLSEKLHHAAAQGKVFYEQFIENAQKSSDGVKNLGQAKRLLYAASGPLGIPLGMIAEGNFEKLLEYKEEFTTRWITGEICHPNMINNAAIHDFISECWDKARANPRSRSFHLQGKRMNNLVFNIRKLLGFICECYVLLSFDEGLRSEYAVTQYQHVSPQVMEYCEILIDQIDKEMEESQEEENIQKSMGLYILRLTARSLLRKIDGSWDENIARMCFAPFLKSDWILLKEDFLPDLEGTFLALPDFNILARIRNHEKEQDTSYEEHLQKIYEEDQSAHNFGTAGLILQYLAAMGKPLPALPSYADACISQSAAATKIKIGEFRRRYALAIAVGQIGHGNAFLENAEQIIRYWYDVCDEAHNYGFLYRLIEHIYEYIHSEAAERKTRLFNYLERLKTNNADLFVQYPQAKERISSLIEDENFSVAEDEISHLTRGDYDTGLEAPEALRYLKDFGAEYDQDYRLVSNLSASVQNLFTRNFHNKEQKGALGLIENWIQGGRNNEERISRLLIYLGWTNINVRKNNFLGNPIEVYHVSQKDEIHGRHNTPHMIAPFGSMIGSRGFEVICLYGATDCMSLMERIASIDGFRGGARLVLIDGVLSAPERRALARKIKKANFFHTYMVLDRVLLAYLHNNYKSSIINRMLIAAGMPFSWYQPYVAESGNYMAPEMFIGRVSELRRIEEASSDQTDSVNLIYGGRQLGKTALLKKALFDIEKSDGKRAVYVDLLNRDSHGAMTALYESLTENGILADEENPADWEDLIGRIRRRLRQEEDSIPYLLVMLDEADDFIKDCSGSNYAPIAEMKKLQETMPDRFKFVIAGLHDIVRFNRASALSENTGIPHLKSLAIKPFSKQEANQLLKGPLSYLGFEIEDDTQATQIIAQTNYFPGLIQLYCQKLVESVHSSDYGGFSEGETPPYKVSNDLIGRVLADNHFIFEIRNKFEMTLRLEKRYYLIALLFGHMSYESFSETGYCAQDILRAAEDLSITSISSLNAEQVETLLAELFDLNILRMESPGTYEFSSDNFRSILGSETDILDKLIATEGGDPS